MLQESEIRKSLLTEQTTLGVDDWLFVINVEVFLVICVGMRFYAWAFVALALHFVLILVTRLQPRILGVYWAYMRQKTTYSSFWSDLPLKRGKRPEQIELIVKLLEKQ